MIFCTSTWSSNRPGRLFLKKLCILLYLQVILSFFWLRFNWLEGPNSNFTFNLIFLRKKWKKTQGLLAIWSEASDISLGLPICLLLVPHWWLMMCKADYLNSSFYNLLSNFPLYIRSKRHIKIIAVKALCLLLLTVRTQSFLAYGIGSCASPPVTATVLKSRGIDVVGEINCRRCILLYCISKWWSEHFFSVHGIILISLHS